jgi:hypothetical protein
MRKIVSRAKGNSNWGLHSEILVLGSSALFGNTILYFVALKLSWRPSYSGINPRELRVFLLFPFSVVSL